jgi:hypothetical protein
MSKKVLISLNIACYLPRPTVPTIGSKSYYQWREFSRLFHIICKQVLLNLLIAMMANTYAANLEKSQLKNLLDSYEIARSASYICQSGAIRGGKGGGKGGEKEWARKR